VRRQLQFLAKEWPTIPDLLRGGFVAGRCATQGGRDQAIVQLQVVICGDGSRLTGKSIAMECFEEPVSTAVACEHSAGAVAAVGCRRQADDYQRCCRIPKSRQGESPILLGSIPADLIPRRPFAPLDEARALPATDDGVFQFAKASYVDHKNLQAGRFPLKPSQALSRLCLTVSEDKIPGWI